MKDIFLLLCWITLGIDFLMAWQAKKHSAEVIWTLRAIVTLLILILLEH